MFRSWASFVRSVTMDKWKDLELEKMKVGGNRKAKQFLSTQADWNSKLPFNERYNTRAAALLKDKVAAEAQGKPWSPETASVNAKNARVIPSYGSGILSLSSNDSSPSTTTTTSSSKFGGSTKTDNRGYQNQSNSIRERNSDNDWYNSNTSSYQSSENSRVRDGYQSSSAGNYSSGSGGGSSTGFGNDPTYGQASGSNQFGFNVGDLNLDGAISSIYSGFSALASTASKLASVSASKAQEGISLFMDKRNSGQ